MSISPSSSGFTDPEAGVEDGEAALGVGCSLANEPGRPHPPQAEISRAEATTASSPMDGVRYRECLTTPLSSPLIRKV